MRSGAVLPLLAGAEMIVTFLLGGVVQRGDQVVAVDQSGPGRAWRHSAKVTTQITGIR